MCLAERTPRDAALAQLASLDPTALDAAALMDQIADLATFISQARGHLTRLAGALDATGGAADAGHKSASGFLRTRCGLSPGHAAGVTHTARALRDLDATAAAVQAGTISFDQAQIIARTAGQLGEAAAATAERALLDHAPGLDTARFRQFADEVTSRVDPAAAEEREKKRWDKRHLSFGLTLDNTGVLSGACGDAVSLEIVRTAVEAFGTPAGELDTRTAAQRRMDGLVAACRAALDAAKAPGRHGAAPHISILVHDQTLAQAAAQSAGEAADGPPPAGPAGAAPGQRAGSASGSAAGSAPDSPGAVLLAAAGAPPGQTGHGTSLTARQVLALCCGAQVSAIRWRDGLPLGVGRAMRTEPAGLRRALEARDRGCRWPGCGALAAWATAHHLIPWAHGGATSLDDLALLCHVHHHYFIHLLGWQITGDPNATLHFTGPGGWLTLDSPRPAPDLLAA